MKLPTTEDVRLVAEAIGHECLTKGTRPSYAEVARRFERNARWLTDSPTEAIERLRFTALHTWIVMGVMPPLDARRKSPEMPYRYPTGDDLLGILSHPGRLHMFCRLAESGGIETALRYAQQQHERIYAEPSPPDAA
jgi:hypothetical protein